MKNVPVTIWIDRAGVIVDTHLGFEDAVDLNERTDRLLAGQN